MRIATCAACGRPEVLETDGRCAKCRDEGRPADPERLAVAREEIAHRDAVVEQEVASHTDQAAEDALLAPTQALPTWIPAVGALFGAVALLGFAAAALGDGVDGVGLKVGLFGLLGGAAFGAFALSRRTAKPWTE
jgi:hypothetical protein